MEIGMAVAFQRRLAIRDRLIWDPGAKDGSSLLMARSF